MTMLSLVVLEHVNIRSIAHKAFVHIFVDK